MARYFNGINQEVAFASVPITSPLSFSCWAWADQSTTDHEMIGTDEADGFFTFHVDDVNGALTNITRLIMKETAAAGGTQVIGLSQSNVALEDTWQHMFCSLEAASATGAQMWVDGAEVTNSPYNVSALANFGADPNTINFGQSGAGGRDRTGRLAECALWNRILTDDEIIILSKGYSPLFIPDGIYFYAPFIGRFDPEVDLVGAISGTVTGATTETHPRIIYPYGDPTGIKLPTLKQVRQVNAR